MDIISRTAWGAKLGDGNGPAPLPVSEVYLHHSVTVAPDLVQPFDDDYAAVRTLERIGGQRFGAVYGVSYTFVVTPVGLVFQGHAVGQLGAHTGGRNSKARAICLIGDYETNRPTEAQLDAVAALLRHGVTQGWWREALLTGGHRDAPGASTACPGRHAHALIGEINRRAASGGAERHHVVVRGDTLWSIVRRYGVTAAALKQLNGLASDVIHPGQRLRLPRATAPPTHGPRVLELATPWMEGDDVRAVQRVLAAWYGLGSGWVDGRFGPATERYVIRAQVNTPPHPKLAGDGRVGPLTRRKLGLG